MAIPNYQANAGDFYTLDAQRKFYISDDWTIEQIITLAEQHSMSSDKYAILYDYYKGNHRAIRARTFDDKNKPNNRVSHNFPKLIVDTATAYLAGEPITQKGDEATIEAMKPVLKRNNYANVDAEITKKASIFGHAFEIHWINDRLEHRFKAVSPQNCFIAYSFDLDEEPVVAVYYKNVGKSIDGKFIRMYEVYTEDSIYKFTSETPDGKYKREDVTHTQPEVYTNVLKRFPVIETIANEERIGDFEAQIPAIDAYNIAVSDSINDIAYWNDAYLWLDGFDMADEDSIANMKNDKVIVTDGTGKVGFITKNVNDKHIENVKNRLKSDIFSFSQVPDIASKDFNAASGTAMKAATQPLENKSAMKETKFRESLEKRYEIICAYIELRAEKTLKLKPEDVEPIFVRNLPQSYSELADMAVKLRGIMSDQSIVSLFPFVTDAKEEVKLAEEQNDRRAAKQLETFRQQKLMTTTGTNSLPKSEQVDPEKVQSQEQLSAQQRKPKDT